MTSKDKKELEKIENFKTSLNLIVIFGLFFTTFLPSYIFFVLGPGEFKWLALIILISYLVSLIPDSIHFRFQISKDLRFYKKMGVDKFKRYASSGDLINKRIRKKYPTYRNVTNLDSVEQKLKETYSIERGHTVLFIFFLMINIYVFYSNSIIIGIILFLGNTLFNFYPNLLQQYYRIRFKKVIENYS